MGIDAAISVQVPAGYKDEINQLLEVYCIEGETGNDDMHNFEMGYQNLRRVDELIEYMLGRQITATLWVTCCSDPSIDDFRVEIKQQEGEWVSQELSYLSIRELETLEGVAEQLCQGAGLDQLKTWLDQRIAGVIDPTKVLAGQPLQ